MSLTTKRVKSRMSYLQNFKYELQGPDNAPKLVFLHGVMGSGANWRKITPQFQKDFRILTYDQRGHGWSFKPPSGYAPEDYSEDLRKILDELGWEKINLVGHSMGGRNALRFTHDYPHRVEKLVIEDIGPQGQPAAMEKTLAMVEMVPAPFTSKAAAKEYFLGEFKQKLGGDQRAHILAQYFYTNIESLPDGQATWRFSKDAIIQSLRAGHFHPRWHEVEVLRIPTLFIRGQYSEDFPRDEYEKVIQLNSNVRGVEIPDAGHWVHYDQADEFSRVLRQFLLEK